MTFKSSNSEWVESLADEILVEQIRTAMGEGCITPSHVYDLVDELLCRFSSPAKARRYRCELHKDSLLKKNDIVVDSIVLSNAEDVVDWLKTSFSRYLNTEPNADEEKAFACGYNVIRSSYTWVCIKEYE